MSMNYKTNACFKGTIYQSSSIEGNRNISFVFWRLCRDN